MTKHPSLITSFSHAINGIRTFFLNDRNGRIHLAVAVWISVAGFYFELAVTEWALILICFAIVISIEMLNHAIENVCDSVHTAQHPLIKIAKDVAAGAVLWSVVISVIIGVLIFIPKINAIL